jgi:hypothetical protein
VPYNYGLLARASRGVLRGHGSGTVTDAAPSVLPTLAVFTASVAYLVGAGSSFYNTNIVLIAFGITLGVVVALTLFACQVCAAVRPLRLQSLQ